MPQVLLSIILGYFVKELAADASVDEPAIKAKCHATIESLVKYKVVDDILEKGVDHVLDATVKMLQDQADVKSALVAIAAKDMGAATEALKALLRPVVASEFVPLLAAA
jgi:hypothetical protein